MPEFGGLLSGGGTPKVQAAAAGKNYANLVTSSPLDVLRSELFKPITVNNVEFVEGDIKTTNKLEKSLELEVEVCSKSTVFLKRLLENYESTPKSVLSAVLTNESVISNLLGLRDTFTFGHELPLDEKSLENVKLATRVFNGSCIPLVMWPSKEATKVSESAIFDALNIYFLRKHNREVYVEVGTLLSHEDGTLPIDVSDATVLREISDVITDEILSALWCIVYIGNLYIGERNDVPPIFEAYKNAFLSEKHGLLDKLWSRYLACSEHVKARVNHIKAGMTHSMNDKWVSRTILEVNGLVVLQNALIIALATLHNLKGEMSLQMFNSYASVFILEDFSGVYSCSAGLVGSDLLASSPILANNVHELQTSCTFLLSIFYLLKRDSLQNGEESLLKIHDEFILPILQRWELKEGTGNRALAIPFFLHLALLKRSGGPSRALVNGIAVPEFITRSSRFLHKYSESVEWICLTRSIFESFVYARLARLILAESFTRLLDSLEIPILPKMNKIACALDVVTRDLFFVDYFAESVILENLCTCFTQQFPYDMGTFIQLLSALLPLTDGLLRDDSGLVLKNRERMGIIVRTLLRKVVALNVSPLTADLIFENGHYVSNANISVELQLLSMLGLDANLFAENWSNWELGDCLYFLPKGSPGVLREFPLSDDHNGQEGHQDVQNGMCRDLSEAKGGWMNGHVESSDGGWASHHVGPGRYWIKDSGLSLAMAEEASSVNLSCIRFSTEGTLMISYGNEPFLAEGADYGAEFTILRSLWIVWKSCIAHLANTPYELDDVALQTFVSCNALLSRLLINFPSLFYLIESHLSSTIHVKETDSPLGPCSLVYHFTLVFVLALQRNGLRVVLPDVIAALSSFLVPNYAVPLEENAMEIEFHRYWMFLYSLEHILGTRCGVNVFILLSRVLQEEEKSLKIYPVTCAMLGFFKNLLKVCPPELWVLHSIHHGLWNISHSSLTKQSRDIFMGISCSHIKSLQSRLEPRAGAIYSPFQSFFLCEALSFSLKTVGTNVAELEFSDANQRLEMMLSIVEIALLASRIFKVCSNGHSCSTEGRMMGRMDDHYDAHNDGNLGHHGVGTPYGEDEWMRGLDELGNQVLRIFSESNYVAELIRILSCQMDILRGKNESLLVMVNPLVFSEVSLSFFTPRLQNMRMMAPLFLALKDTDIIGRECKVNPRFRWLAAHDGGMNSHHNGMIIHSGKKIIECALELVRQLQLVALPRGKSFIFGTLAKALGGEFFSVSKPSSQTPFLSTFIYTESDPISYYVQTQLCAMRTVLPQAPLVQSIIAHVYSGYNFALATDILTLHMLLNEFYEEDAKYPGDRGHLMDQLGLTKGADALLSVAVKEESFVEHLVCTFFDSRLCGYDECISILQYFIVCLETKIGAEFLKSEGISVGFDVLTNFIDSVLRLHILNGMNGSNRTTVSLGNVIVVQLALVAFSRLVMVHGDHKGTRLCWETVKLVLATLVDMLTAFDHFGIVFSQLEFSVLPMLDYRRGIDSALDLSIPLSRSEALLEKKMAVLAILGSIYNILVGVSMHLPSSRHDDHFVNILEYISMSWEFIEALFPSSCYNDELCRSGDSPVSHSGGTEKRLGLWLGDDPLGWLSKALNFASTMGVSAHNLLLKSPAHNLCSFDFFALNILHNLQNSHPSDGYRMQEILSDVARYTSGVAELNFLSRLAGHRMVPDGCKQEGMSSYEQGRIVWEFFSFGTAENYGLSYLMDISRFSCISTILMCKRGYGVDVYDLENVKSFIKMTSLLESMNDVKCKTLAVLFDIVRFAKTHPDVFARKNVDWSARGHVDTSERPFEAMAVNLTMTAQLVLASPSVCHENSLYLGILIKLLALLNEWRPKGVMNDGQNDHSAHSIIHSFERFGAVQGSDAGTLAINVFGGLVAQLVQFVSSNIGAFEEVPRLVFNPRSGYRFHKRFLVAVSSKVDGMGKTFDEELIWLQLVILHSFSVLYRHFSAIVKEVLSSSTHPNGSFSHSTTQEATEQVETLYRNVTRHIVANLSRVSQTLLELCSRWERQIVDLFSQFGKLDASVFISVFAPVVATRALKNVVLDHNDGHCGHIFLLSDILTSHSFMSCFPISAEHTWDKNVTAESSTAHLLSNVKDGKLCYENCNFLCTIVVKCLDHLLSMLIHSLRNGTDGQREYACDHNANNVNVVNRMNAHYGDSMDHNDDSGVSHNDVHNEHSGHHYGEIQFTLSQRIIKSHLVQKIYAYPFASYFVQPISSITPKSALESYLGPEEDGMVTRRLNGHYGHSGDCIDVLEGSIDTWYPYHVHTTHIMDTPSVPIRCNLHLLHCKVLHLVSLLDGSSETPIHILVLLQTLQERVRHVFTGSRTSIAQLEEALLYFTLLRRLPSRHSLSSAHLKTIAKFLRWSVVHFCALTDVMNGRTFCPAGSPRMGQECDRRNGPNGVSKDDHNAQDVPYGRHYDHSFIKMDERENRQALLYLVLANASAFLSFLLDLKLTASLKDELPPTADAFLTDGPVTQDAVGLSKAQFKLALGTGSFSESRGTPIAPSPVTLELLFSLFGVATDLGAMALSMMGEWSIDDESDDSGYTLDASGRPILHGYKEGDRVLPSHSSLHSSRLPLPSPGDLKKLIEAVVEKALLFGSQFVNTLIIQNGPSNGHNGYSDHSMEYGRSIDTHYVSATGSKEWTEECIESPARPPDGVLTHSLRSKDLRSHAPFAVLGALCMNVEAHEKVTSGSLQEFNSVISEYISRKRQDAKKIREIFGDTRLFLC